MEISEPLADGLEIVGMLVIAAGGVSAAFRAVFGLVGEHRDRYTTFRREFARALIIGLEILVAADVVLTVTVDRTVEASLVLAILVLVRVVLGWSIEIEVHGYAPWVRWRVETQREHRLGAGEVTDP